MLSGEITHHSWIPLRYLLMKMRQRLKRDSWFYLSYYALPWSQKSRAKSQKPKVGKKVSGPKDVQCIFNQLRKSFLSKSFSFKRKISLKRIMPISHYSVL